MTEFLLKNPHIEGLKPEETRIEKIILNTKEACSYLGLNRNLLDSYRRAGLIRSLKAGRLYLYPISELNAFVSKNIGKEITKEGIVYESC